MRNNRGENKIGVKDGILNEVKNDILFGGSMPFLQLLGVLGILAVPSLY